MWRGGGSKPIGVLAVEKNGYMLNDLISGIRFLQTGEAYIINAEGTDIAVSDLSHISWVTSQYNAREIVDFFNDALDAKRGKVVYAALKSNGLTGFEDIKSLVLDCYYGFE